MPCHQLWHQHTTPAACKQEASIDGLEAVVHQRWHILALCCTVTASSAASKVWQSGSRVASTHLRRGIDGLEAVVDRVLALRSGRRKLEGQLAGQARIAGLKHLPATAA